MGYGGQLILESRLHLYHKQHVSILRCISTDNIKILPGSFLCNCRGEGTKLLSFFDQPVQMVAHIRMSWISKNTAVAQCAWPKLHPPLKPCDYAPFSKITCDSSD